MTDLDYERIRSEDRQGGGLMRRLLCWLLGHRWVIRTWERQVQGHVFPERLEFCVRCQKEKE